VEKKNIGMKVLFVILCLVVISFTGYIVYDAVYSNNNDITDKNGSEKTSWADYLLSCNIVKATIERDRSKDLGDLEDFNNTINITLDNVNEIFSIFKNSKLSKIWSLGRGGQTRDHLVIVYKIDNVEYDFKIYNGNIVVDGLDSEFKNILDKNKYDEKDNEYKNMEGSFYYYNINDYNEVIFDKYFK